MHWVDRTFWNISQTGQFDRFDRVPDYALFNVNIDTSLPGKFEGLELSVAAINLFDHKHFELPGGLSGEKLGRRLSANIRYAF